MVLRDRGSLFGMQRTGVFLRRWEWLEGVSLPDLYDLHQFSKVPTERCVLCSCSPKAVSLEATHPVHPACQKPAFSGWEPQSSHALGRDDLSSLLGSLP